MTDDVLDFTLAVTSAAMGYPARFGRWTASEADSIVEVWAVGSPGMLRLPVGQGSRLPHSKEDWLWNYKLAIDNLERAHVEHWRRW